MPGNAHRPSSCRVFRPRLAMRCGHWHATTPRTTDDELLLCCSCRVLASVRCAGIPSRTIWSCTVPTSGKRLIGDTPRCATGLSSRCGALFVCLPLCAEKWSDLPGCLACLRHAPASPHALVEHACVVPVLFVVCVRWNAVRCGLHPHAMHFAPTSHLCRESSCRQATLCGTLLLLSATANVRLHSMPFSVV